MIQMILMRVGFQVHIIKLSLVINRKTTLEPWRVTGSFSIFVKRPNHLWAVVPYFKTNKKIKHVSKDHRFLLEWLSRTACQRNAVSV